MPSVKSISAVSHSGKSHFRPEYCVFCAFDRIWKHGIYSRKATYAKNFKNPPEAKVVQRYLCQNPSCKRTFGQLSENSLPYCRFPFEEFLLIQKELVSGKSSYSIWKSCQLLFVSLAAIKRLVILFHKALTFIQNWCRELDIPISTDFRVLFSELLLKHSWFTFSIRWYHALYPRRLWQL